MSDETLRTTTFLVFGFVLSVSVTFLNLYFGMIVTVFYMIFSIILIILKLNKIISILEQQNKE